MDEILIEEKKYISSKRAAKMTGYAKDYIGQLCREGRVPAQLVGRSWYVLETAIQDHRFGDPEIEPVKEEKPEEPSLVSTWESPRYEAFSEEPLPSINRLEPQSLQDSWKEWFDRFDQVENKTEPVTSAPEEPEEPKAEEKNEEQEEAKEVEVEEDTEVNVPIHTIYHPLYQPPPEELLPHKPAVLTPSEQLATQRKSGKWSNRMVVTTIQIAGAAIAMIVATLAVIGSGYFDAYIISSSPVRIIAGVALYNK